MTGKFKVGDRVVSTVGEEVRTSTVVSVGPIPGGFDYSIEDDGPEGLAPGAVPRVRVGAGPPDRGGCGVKFQAGDRVRVRFRSASVEGAFEDHEPLLGTVVCPWPGPTFDYRVVEDNPTLGVPNGFPAFEDELTLEAP